MSRISLARGRLSTAHHSWFTACNETLDRPPATNLRLNLIIEIDRHNIFCIAMNSLDRHTVKFRHGEGLSIWLFRLL